MSHETHHHTDNQTGSSSGAAFWFVLILVGLFIGAINFVNVMGHDEEGHDAGHETHIQSGDHNASGQATQHGATENEAAHHEAGPSEAEPMHNEGH